MPKYKRVYSTPKTTKPDLQDNLNKAFFDALEGLIYEQDQNIVEIKSMRKYYSEENQVKVRFVY
jgi:Holliday junction resolvase RusA-like endonuclease